MHLTLTVPHSQKGWRGREWYANELMKEFNYMRKKAFWKRMVYSGEFGVEVTRNDDGMHIHIHALLLVYKRKQNRNELHRFILEAWNRQTQGSSQRTCFSEEEITAILKSNKLLTPEYVDQLFPCGATFVGLESLYLRSTEPKRGYHWCERSGAYKRYVSLKDGKDIFLAGIMECIKYHFEPMATKKDGTYDFDLICDILPAIKGKPLFRKFGAFHSGSKNAHPGAKELNINYKDENVAEEAAEDLQDFGRAGREVEEETLWDGIPTEVEQYLNFLIVQTYEDISQGEAYFYEVLAAALNDAANEMREDEQQIFLEFSREEWYYLQQLLPEYNEEYDTELADLSDLVRHQLGVLLAEAGAGFLWDTNPEMVRVLKFDGDLSNEIFRDLLSF
eukprot:g389.t1